MKIDLSIKPMEQGRRPDRLALALACTAVVLSAYTATFAVALGLTFPQALAGSAANTIPTMLFGIAAYWAVRIFVVHQPLLIQVPVHVAIGASFSVLCYWLTTIFLGVVSAASLAEFSVHPLPHPASAWQLLQNLTTYGIIATLAHLHAVTASPAVALPGSIGHPSQSLNRYFIKDGDDLVPINVDKIVAISGADDYCEVATLEGRHLVRRTMAEFEGTLDPQRFVRIHRSRIVNLQHVQRAEPAGGGRLLVLMDNGESILASRSGTKQLRKMML